MRKSINVFILLVSVLVVSGKKANVANDKKFACFSDIETSINNRTHNFDDVS